MSFVERGSRTRPVLKPAGKKVGVSQLPRSGGKKAELKSPRLQRRPDGWLFESDGSFSSDSSGSLSSLRMADFQHRRKQNVVKSVKIVPESLSPSASPVLEKKRCGWITPQSDTLYISFHDEEWGVPVHDDRKLFELLVLTEALSELSWPTILNKRGSFRKLFDNFEPASIATFNEKKILSLKASGSALLSEPKIRAVVENARQMLKVVEEFGSFSNYCWSFVNEKPVLNGFRYARQVPVKTPKSEAISKDLMQRGFRCVGPSIVYSFMQAAGIVNDHLSCCFRYKECNLEVKIDCHARVDEMETLSKVVEQTCSLQA